MQFLNLKRRKINSIHTKKEQFIKGEVSHLQFSQLSAVPSGDKEARKHFENISANLCIYLGFRILQEEPDKRLIVLSRTMI